MAKTYDTVEILYEEFDWQGELCDLTLEVEYSVSDFWPAHEYEAPCGGELEVELVKVIRALVGENRFEADSQQLADMQKQIKNDLGAWHKIHDLVCALVES